VTGTVESGGGNAAIPAAALRGGDWYYGTSAGLFALYLDGAPSGRGPGLGFRCSIGR
jgi:hypothetical protein